MHCHAQASSAISSAQQCAFVKENIKYLKLFILLKGTWHVLCLNPGKGNFAQQSWASLFFYERYRENPSGSLMGCFFVTWDAVCLIYLSGHSLLTHSSSCLSQACHSCICIWQQPALLIKYIMWISPYISASYPCHWHNTNSQAGWGFSTRIHLHISPRRHCCVGHRRIYAWGRGDESSCFTVGIIKRKENGQNVILTHIYWDERNFTWIIIN